MNYLSHISFDQKSNYNNMDINDDVWIKRGELLQILHLLRKDCTHNEVYDLFLLSQLPDYYRNILLWTLAYDISLLVYFNDINVLLKTPVKSNLQFLYHFVCRNVKKIKAVECVSVIRLCKCSPNNAFQIMMQLFRSLIEDMNNK